MMLTPPQTPTLAATKATRSSRFHFVAVTLMLLAGVELVAPGTAHAQKPPKKGAAPAEPDPRQVELEQKLAEEQAARQAAEAKQAEQEKKIEAQDAQIKAQADAQAAQAKRLDAMEKQLGDEAKARAEAEARVQGVEKKTAETPPAVGATRLGIGITGFAQADWQMRQSSEDEVVESTGEPKNDDRFLLRRARLKVTADYGHVGSALELDANTSKGSQVRVVDAELSYKLDGEAGGPPLVLATMGLFKIPFGYEVVQSDRDRLFMERSSAERALFPGEYDVGARLSGGWRFVRWALAAQNGDPLGEKAFPGRDPNSAKDLTGHVGVDAKIGGSVGLAGGFSALTGTGFHKGTPQTKDILVWSDVNENGSVDVGEIQVKPGQAATASQNFDRFAVGGDLRLSLKLPVLGKLELAGELVVATNLDRATLVADPVTQGRDVRELGWYVAVTQELGERLVIGARYDFYDPDSDSSDREGGVIVPSDASYSTLALDAGIRYEHGRLVGEYQHNRNHLGRDVAGLPTNLDDDAFVLRAQVEF